MKSNEDLGAIIADIEYARQKSCETLHNFNKKRTTT